MGQAPKITAIEPQKTNPHRYSIFIDGQFALGVTEEVIVNLGLRPHQPVSEAKLDEITFEEQVQQARKAALRLLEYRPRSRQELRRRLRQKDFPVSAISRVLDRLEERGLVADEDFAQQLVCSLARRRNLGKRAILDKLRRAGISRDIAEATIERELADYDEASRAQQAAEKYLPHLADLAPEKQRRRLQAYLYRRGFSYSIIDQVRRSALADYQEQ